MWLFSLGFFAWPAPLNHKVEVEERSQFISKSPRESTFSENEYKKAQGLFINCSLAKAGGCASGDFEIGCGEYCGERQIEGKK